MKHVSLNVARGILAVAIPFGALALTAPHADAAGTVAPAGSSATTLGGPVGPHDWWIAPPPSK